MDKYEMRVYCRRNGVSMDAGTHMEREFESDSDFFQEVAKEKKWLGRFYDEVHVCCHKNGKKIETKTEVENAFFAVNQ